MTIAATTRPTLRNIQLASRPNHNATAPKVLRSVLHICTAGVAQAHHPAAEKRRMRKGQPKFPTMLVPVGRQKCSTTFARNHASSPQSPIKTPRCDVRTTPASNAGFAKQLAKSGCEAVYNRNMHHARGGSFHIQACTMQASVGGRCLASYVLHLAIDVFTPPGP